MIIHANNNMHYNYIFYSIDVQFSTDSIFNIDSKMTEECTISFSLTDIFVPLLLTNKIS